VLALVTATKWEGDPNLSNFITTAAGTKILFNGSNINGIKTRASVKSQFMFSTNRYDHRAKASYVEAEGTAASIVTMADKTFQSSFITLSLYPDNDTSQTAVATRINCESISFAVADPTSAARSYVCYFEGGKKMFKLCTYSLSQIYWLADTGVYTTS
jgi:hypothetical protein